MKKTYIKPVCKTMVCEDFCSLNMASVHNISIEEKAFDHFDVIGEEQSKTEYSGLWGDTNKDKWGDD